MFQDRERAGIERLGVEEAALVAIDVGKLSEALRDRRLVGTQSLFADRERAGDERLGFVGSGLEDISAREVAQGLCHGLAVRSELRLADFERVLIELFGGGEMALGEFRLALLLGGARFLERCLLLLRLGMTGGDEERRPEGDTQRKATHQFFSAGGWARIQSAMMPTTCVSMPR